MSEGLTGVGHRDLIDLIGVEPDLALAALEDARGQALLQLQRHHLRRRRSPLPAVWLWRKGLQMRRTAAPYSSRGIRVSLALKLGRAFVVWAVSLYLWGRRAKDY
jgi:hypothetical protein